MNILVIAEHDGAKISSATKAAVGAAGKISDNIEVLLASDNESVAVDACKIAGVKKVLFAKAEYYAHNLAEDIAPLGLSLAQKYSHILMAATAQGKDILPRIAASLGVAQVSDIISIESADVFVRPIYAGNAWETVQALDAIKLLTIRPTAFEKALDGGAAELEEIAALPANQLTNFVQMHATHSDRPELTSARIVVSGGRGVGSAENFKLIEQLADSLGAAVGASRAAVDSGFAPNDWQVGQTGKIVAPELYIAVGISGAIQHLAGMKDSKIIVAINKDENAPIFEVADYGLVADLFTAVPELIDKAG